MPATGSTMTAAMSAPCSAKSALDRVEVVVRRDERVARRRPPARRASRACRASRRREPACDEQAVGVAVVAAVELDDLASRPVNAAREPQRAHRRLGARARRSAPSRSTAARRAISSASSTSSAVGAPKLVPRRSAASTRRDDLRVRVAEDQRAPRADVVDVAVAVDVEEVRALAAVDEERRAADGAERAHGRVHAAREERRRLREQALGPVAAHTAAPASAPATDSAAASPEAMQSGIPTPWYAAPATAQSGMRDERGLDPLEPVGMADDVLRHPERPAVDAGQEWLRGDTEELDLGARGGHELVVRVERDVTRSEASHVDAQEHGLLGRPVLPLLRRPGAGEHVSALGARHHVAVPVERHDVGAREPE